MGRERLHHRPGQLRDVRRRPQPALHPHVQRDELGLPVRGLGLRGSPAVRPGPPRPPPLP
jgi:hypothetical protein